VTDDKQYAEVLRAMLIAEIADEVRAERMRAKAECVFVYVWIVMVCGAWTATALATDAASICASAFVTIMLGAQVWIARKSRSRARVDARRLGRLRAASFGGE